MKTSYLIRSLFTVALPAVLTIAFVGCGGDSGNSYPTRGALNDLPRDQFSLVSPGTGKDDICINPKVVVSLSNAAISNNANICNNTAGLSGLFQILQQGTTSGIVPVISTVPVRSTDSSGKETCTLEMTTGQLEAGSTYYVCAMNSQLSSGFRNVDQNCYNFRTNFPAKTCAGGSNFFVKTIGNQTAFPTSVGKGSNLLDGELPFSPGDLDGLVSSAISALGSALGLGQWFTSVYHPNELVPIEFNRDVNSETISKASIKLIQGSIDGQVVSDTSVTLSSDRRKVFLQLPSRSLVVGTYLVWVNRTVKDATGTQMTSPNVSGNISYYAPIEIRNY